MRMVFTDMLENDRCVGRTPKSAVEMLLLDPCKLLLPYVLTRVSLEASLSLVYAIMVSQTQSHSAILVSRKSIRRFPTPCTRCKPHTPLGQALIREMVSSDGIPHLTHSGDIVVDAASAGVVRALKLVPKLKVDRDMAEHWGNVRRGSQQCLVH